MAWSFFLPENVIDIQWFKTEKERDEEINAKAR